LVVAINVFIFVKFNSSEFSSNFTSMVQNLPSALILSFVFFAAAFGMWLLILYKELWLQYFSESLYVRSVPVLFVLAVTGFQAGLIFLLPNTKPVESVSKNIWKTTLLIYIGFLLIGGFIALTGIGFTFDNVGLNWGTPGVPISFAQVNLVFAIGSLFALGLYIVETFIKINKTILEVLVFISLWIVAVLLWSNQTMSPSHFAPVTTAPNFETYPYSDAALFDRAAMRLVTGVGLGDKLIRRPLYVGLLAIFHSIGGLSYDGAISIQILFLAFIPSLLYLLTRFLSNPTAGVIAGGLIILREANAIRLSGEIPTAHAKLMMSDLPAMLGIIALTYACVVLFKKEKPDIWQSLVIGGILGLIMLLRAQVIVLLPLIILLIIVQRKFGKSAFIEIGLVMAGFILVVTPWVWRNWNITGSFELGDYGEKALLARNYSINLAEYPTPLQSETPAEFSNRLSGEIISYITGHPDDVAYFISNHFLHGLATSAVFLGPAYSNETPSAVVSRYQFWGEWNGSLPGVTLPSLLINFAALAFGIALMQARQKNIGWYPFLFFLVYQAGNAVARTSGWRFSLPVDWIIVFYVSVGLAYLPSMLTKAERMDTDSLVGGTGFSSWSRAALFLLLFFAGLSLPLADNFISKRNFGEVTQDAKEALMSRNILTSVQMDNFLSQKDTVVISGLDLYPRYFRPNGNIYIADMPEDFRYLHFWLLQNDDVQVLLPRDKPPEFFPHAATVVVFGCSNGDYTRALIVGIQTGQGWEFVFAEPMPELYCQ